jgi:hypothetical protein
LSPVLLSILGASAAFIAIPFLTWSYFKGPPVMCALAALNISVQVDNQRIEVKFPLRAPLEVKPGALVTVAAEIESRSEACEGDLSIDWLLSFVSSPSRVKIISETRTREVLQVTVGTRPSQALEEDHIVLTAHDSFGVSELEMLRLKVQGE